MVSDNQLYLAPFQGITGHTFRKVYACHFRGINKYYTPFFSKIDHDTRLSARKEKELQHLRNEFPELVPQILSKDPAEILRFARICESRGFKELNWNLGCPFPQVAHKKRGSGMMPYPDLVNDILEKVMPSIPLKFSIKCRLGYEHPDEIFEMIPVFNQFPIHELTLHGRIGRQLYSGSVDMDRLLKVIPLLRIPFVFNGDILSKSTFDAASKQMPGVNKWMIGRGVLINPFLPADIKGVIDYPDRRAKLRLFMDDLYYAYRVDMNDRLTILNVLKEYWGFLFQWFENPQKVTRIIKKVKTFDEYEDAVKRIFETEEFRENDGTVLPVI